MEKHEKVVQVGIKKEPGYLYYVDKEGDISRASMRNKQTVPCDNCGHDIELGKHVHISNLVLCQDCLVDEVAEEVLTFQKLGENF